MPRAGNLKNTPPIAVAGGGTGAAEVTGARNNLGLGSMATQNSNNVNITGGNASVSNVNASNVNCSLLNCSTLNSTTSSTFDTGTVTNAHRMQVNASSASRVFGNIDQVNASAGCVIESSATASQINASSTSTVLSNLPSFPTFYAQINASSESRNSGMMSQINASARCINTGQQASIVASLGVINNANFVLCGGAGALPETAANKKWELNSASGNLRLAGSVTTSAAFSDYAEFFKNQEDEEIPLGTIVTLEKDGCRVADDGDRILGVVSATGGIVLGDTPFAWQGRYLHGEFSEPIYETIPDPNWTPIEGESEQDRPLIVVPKQNPNWNPKAEQIPRSQRPKEWTCVGMLGQVFVRIGFSANSMDYLMPVGGVGYRSIEPTRLQVMRVTKTYNPALGYGVAKCLLL